LFQFHFGSIGRANQKRLQWFQNVSIPLWFDWKPVRVATSKGIVQFQFHFGSIGSEITLNANVCNNCFNSTLVRLEVSKLLFRECVKVVSIPLWFDWKISRAFNTASFSCFNSTLVRLEVFFLQCAAEGLLSFNSTLVRLEAFQALLGSTRNKVSIPLWFDWKRYRKPVCSAQTRFNSTLVRLEELTPEGYRQGGLFQFHFGSIGSTQSQTLKLKNKLVSIPLWFDWKPIPLELYGQAEYVSIPLWFDWKKKPQQMQETPKQVSIPLWFDWKVSPCAKLY